MSAAAQTVAQDAAHIAAVELARAAASAYSSSFIAEPASTIDWTWYGFDTSEAESCEILIENINSRVCNNELFVKTMLEQAGFEPFVEDMKIQRSSRELRIKLSSRMMATYCIQWFSGCSWLCEGPLQARVLEDKPAMSRSMIAQGMRDASAGAKDAGGDVSDSEQSTVAKSEDLPVSSGEESALSCRPVHRWADLSDDEA